MDKGVQLNLLGKPFSCQVCAHQKFSQETLVVKRGSNIGFLKNDTLRPTVLICKNCGYVHWFILHEAEGVKQHNTDA